MIPGFVDEHYEPRVPLTIRSSAGNKQTISFLVDTGFNGSLTLSPKQVGELGLVWLTHSITTLANGVVEEIDVYVGFVEWDGRLRNIYVEVADTDPLLGTRLLQGHDVFFEAVVGGKVTITARP